MGEISKILAVEGYIEQKNVKKLVKTAHHDKERLLDVVFIQEKQCIFA